MLRILLASIILALATIASAQDKPAGAPAEKPALFATTKVDGTDNVYVFRYGNHQAMFVVTSAGVIAKIGRAHSSHSGESRMPSSA